MTPFLILVVLALVFAVLSFVPPVANYPLLPVAVILLSVAMLIGGR